MPAQSRSDYKRILSELQDALRLSAEAYDQGYKGEAKRLATTVRVLLHDTSQSVSLFTQLGIKNVGKYFATPSPYSKGNILTQCYLVRLVGGAQDLYEPMLDDFPPVFAWAQLDFDEWWNEPVIRDKQKRLLSRRDIVLGLANKDGGAHVAPSLDAKYADLSRRNSLAWVISTAGGISDPEYGPEYACMRQITFELRKSIDVNLASALTSALR